MLSYLLKIFALLLFSFFILFNYYFVFPSHIKDFDWYLIYVIIVSIIYSVYKYFQLEISKEKAIISLNSIIWFFIINLFILCFYFFSISWNNVMNWFILFSKIILFTLLPIFIFLISFSIWKKILAKLPSKELFIKWEFWMLELIIGFIFFITLILIFWLFGFYNLYTIIFILSGFLIFSYRNLLEIFTNISEKKYEFDIKQWSYLNLLSTEFFTFFAFIVLWVGLISIVRPFPIWWDDLGAYMNQPHLIAEAWNLLSLWAMYSWQIFTWIWYMFGSPVPAFYLNITWLFLSFIILVNVLSKLIVSEDNSKKSILNLPIILGTIFISLPMVWFQTIKDLKVDEWLFFITVIALFFLYKYFILFRESKKLPIIYLFLIWIIVWFAFSIKFTALLLFVSIIWVFSFSRLNIYWFIGYIFLLFWLFTFWNLWKMMNVIINPNSIPWFENIFWISWILIWFFLIAYSYFKNKSKWFLFLKEVSVFILWFFIILSPWFIKNIFESYPTITISSIIWWKSDNLNIDFKSIYSEDELNKIRLTNINLRKKENIITTNEDLLRYFWYEKWIIDFVYMPWNLTMQVNQKGEYTDIWFLFLAFIPIIFIFLPFRKKYYSFFFIFISIFQIVLYFQNDSKVIKNDLFNSLESSKLNIFLQNNNYVLLDKKNNYDIFDIKLSNYIDDDVLKTWILKDEIDVLTKDYIKSLAISEIEKLSVKSSDNEKEDYYNKLFLDKLNYYNKNYDEYYSKIYLQEFNKLNSKVNKMFYSELKEKVINIEKWSWFTFLDYSLTEDDFNYIKELNNLYYTSSIFKINDITSLNQLLIKNEFSEKEITLINKVWNDNRNIKGFLIDIMSKINLPLWYLFIFSWFILPTLFLLLTLKNTKLLFLFKLNLVFAVLYTFLWLISSFWIVWYGITMYFSFLLMIWISTFYIINYKNEEDVSIYNWKILWSVVFLLIILLYFFNSIIPYVFSNLKEAWYEKFKSWDITQSEAIFWYHKDYLNILFNLNIDQNKKELFFKKYISQDILKSVKDIEKRELSYVFQVLRLMSDDPNFSSSSNISMQRLYKNIQNPIEEFKNKEKIYRVWTFLKYFISENNTRLYEDSLLFNFNDYIYNENNDITIDRFKKLWLKYLLIDLNAATIDQSDSHDLTIRYEKMLKLFTHSSLELIDTDNICLLLWIEEYKKTRDINNYMTFAWVNYDSYDKDNKKINRQEKIISCAKYIDKLIDENKIDNENYPFLLQYKVYFESNPKSIESIISIISNSYKVLFKIK